MIQRERAMERKITNNIAERVKIQEKALSALADKIRKRESATEDDLADIRKELKALKLFLARAVPGFKEQFPEMLRKVR